jgi:hypothetical protein
LYVFIFNLYILQCRSYGTFSGLATACQPENEATCLATIPVAKGTAPKCLRRLALLKATVTASPAVLGTDGL